MATLQELQLKHLEMTQSVIKRLAQNSFLIKGWSVTLVSVVFALVNVKNAGNQLILVTLIPTLILWGLDAYYLQQERFYRKLYEAVARDLRNDVSIPSVGLFTMDTRPYRLTVRKWVWTLFSKSVLPIPLMLSLIIVAYWLVS